MNRFWAILLGITLVGSIVMNFLGPSYEAEKIWDIKTFFAIYGFVGCVAIIYISKALGKYWLFKDLDYYEPHRAPRDVGDAGTENEGEEPGHA